MNVLKQLYLTSDYHDKSGMIFNADCMELMSNIKQDGVFDVTLTDIPYDMVNRKDNGLRNLNKDKADIITFPSPMNGQHIYLSGIENAIWFKKRGATFNAHCKNTVFEFPSGRSKIHPTEKNHELIKDLILDNSNEGDIIFDPCAGSLAHCLVAKENGRRYVGCELQKEYFDKGIERLKEQK